MKGMKTVYYMKIGKIKRINCIYINENLKNKNYDHRLRTK